MFGTGVAIILGPSASHNFGGRSGLSLRPQGTVHAVNRKKEHNTVCAYLGAEIPSNPNIDENLYGAHFNDL